MKSEQVVGFILECMAGFVGIRTLSDDTLVSLSATAHSSARSCRKAPCEAVSYTAPWDAIFSTIAAGTAQK
ncbi:hypothetical protein [Aurantimonas sp. NFXS3]|jgi:hypothetical protein|uniref:hypothetical protein n=1 Tax=Aurantimonas sp. NFXS3 TaxID=2818434 RepID=UPI003B8D1B47